MEGVSATLLHGFPGTVDLVRGPQRPPEHVFMQDEPFGPEEYRQMVAYHYCMARHHPFKA
jgi:hypothetical protein